MKSFSASRICVNDFLDGDFFQARSMEKKKKAGKYVKKVKAKQRRREHVGANQLEPDEFANVWDEEE